nr:unnamed protein product [Haemonchus contortus]
MFYADVLSVFGQSLERRYKSCSLHGSRSLKKAGKWRSEEALVQKSALVQVQVEVMSAAANGMKYDLCFVM